MNNTGILRFSNFPADIVRGLDENKNVLPIKTASSVLCRTIQEGCFTRCSLAGRMLSIVPIALLTCAASVLAVAESVASLAYAIFLTTLHTLTFFRSEALQNHTVKCWSYFFNSSALIISPALLLLYACRDDFERRIGLDLLHINCAQAAHSMGQVFDFFACRRGSGKVYAAAIQGTAQILNINARYLDNTRIYDLGDISTQSVKRFLENKGLNNNTLYPYKDYVLSHLTAYGVRMIARGMIRERDQEAEARREEVINDRYFDWGAHLNELQQPVQNPPVPERRIPEPPQLQQAPAVPEVNPQPANNQPMGQGNRPSNILWPANLQALLDRPIVSRANNNDRGITHLDEPVNPVMNQQNSVPEKIKADKKETLKDVEKTKLPELVKRPLREGLVSTWTYQNYLTDYILPNAVRNFYANEDLLDYMLLDGERQSEDIDIETRAVMNNVNRDERINDIKDSLASFMGPLYELSRFLALEEVVDIANQLKDSSSDCFEHLECPTSMEKRRNLLGETVKQYKKLLDKGEDQILQLKKALVSGDNGIGEASKGNKSGKVSGDNSSGDDLMKKIYVNIALLGRDYVETNENNFGRYCATIRTSLMTILAQYEPNKIDA